MIVSFHGREAADVWARRRVPSLAGDLQRAALRKLLVLDAADNLNDLRSPPGNRLERLAGDRQGQHSICINQQWRLCFVWSQAGPSEVEITDYH